MPIALTEAKDNRTDATAQADFLADFGAEMLAGRVTTDGLRLTLALGRVIHLRPSATPRSCGSMPRRRRGWKH
ncbi:hypothetical protein [Hyphobacterium vulgare]|uniref:Uncharacterized protein n=2 Tax=Hyphobacterium TaxID=2004661 RepID=A0ABV6ZVH1_9PROT